MYFSEQITLRTASNAFDSLGDVIPTYTDKFVFCNRKSATRSEYYNAKFAGTKISEVFEVHTEDYSEQDIILYGSAQYTVERSFRKGEGIIELICVKREV